MKNDRLGERHRIAPPVLYRFAGLRTFTIGATDGDIGTVHDLFFDDQSWTVRYLVVDTGTWLPGRKVLISPMSIEAIDGAEHRVLTTLTKDQVKASPDIDTAMPVSRQHEVRLQGYYGYPEYWAGPYRWGLWADPYGAVVAPEPPMVTTETSSRAVLEEIAAGTSREGDRHLHSARDVSGSGIRATDGDLGHVEDFLIDDGAWALRYLIVDPQNWWPGQHVLLSTDWVSGINWDERRVEVDVSRDAVRKGPPYDPEMLVDRDWELRFHGFHGRRGYWERPHESWRGRPAA